MQIYDIEVPISVPVSGKKNFSLNLNQYRNAHHLTLSRAKNVFHEQVASKVMTLPKMQQVKLTYTLYKGTQHLLDTSNVCSIVDKFFCDVMTKCGRIEDDNHDFVLSVDYRYGGYIKDDGKVIVSIEPVGDIVSIDPEEKEEDMQITIVQTEIEDAIRNHILGQINVKEGMRIDIDLRATRGAEGFQAIIDIVPQTTKAPKASLKIKESVEAAKAPAEAPVEDTGTIEAELPASENQPAVAEEEELAPAEPVADETPRASLFGGLSKAG